MTLDQMPNPKNPGADELNAAVTYRRHENNRDPDSVDKYLHLLETAAKKGNRAAMGILAEHLIGGDVYLASDRIKYIQRDPARAAGYLKKLVELSKYPRQNMHEIDDPEMLLAELYKKGDGVECDVQKSLAIYERKALHGTYVAMSRLEKLYYNGAEGFPKDYAKAVYWVLRRYAYDHQNFNPDNEDCLNRALKISLYCLADVARQNPQAYERGLTIYKSDTVETEWRTWRNALDPDYNYTDAYIYRRDDFNTARDDRGPNPYEALRENESKAADYYTALWNNTETVG
jgi:hypothetical protein